MFIFVSIRNSQSTPTQPPPSTQWPNFESKIDQSFFFFLSSSSHLFFNNNAILNPIFFTFFKNYNPSTESNHFHCIPSMYGLLSSSLSNTFLLPLQFMHDVNWTLPQLSLRNPFNPKFIHHPPNSLMIWLAWFDDRRGLRLMIWSTWLGIDVVWWFISSNSLMIGNNRGMIWSNEERESEVRVTETQRQGDKETRREGERRNY